LVLSAHGSVWAAVIFGLRRKFSVERSPTKVMKRSRNQPVWFAV
jgi:hypothetical protein